MSLRNVTASIAFLLVLATVCGGVFWLVLHSREGTSLYSDVRFAELKGKEAPPFSIETLDGRIFNSKELKRPLLLELFASWCDVCESEVPILNRVVASNDADVLAITGDSRGMNMLPESLSDLRKYRRLRDVKFDIAFDPTKRIGRSYEIVGYPSIYLLRRDGTIAYDVSGAIGYDQLHRAIVEAQSTR